MTIAGKTYALPVAVSVIEDMPEVLFGDEIEQKREEWTPRRLEAKRQGRKAYGAWLDERRATEHGRLNLYYGDDEVIAAVREAVSLSVRRGYGKHVPFKAILDRLAPGEYTSEERRPVAYKLSRLTKAGQLRQRAGKPPAWAPA